MKGSVTVLLVHVAASTMAFDEDDPNNLGTADQGHFWKRLYSKASSLGRGCRRSSLELIRDESVKLEIEPWCYNLDPIWVVELEWLERLRIRSGGEERSIREIKSLVYSTLHHSRMRGNSSSEDLPPARLVSSSATIPPHHFWSIQTRKDHEHKRQLRLLSTAQYGREGGRKAKTCSSTRKNCWAKTPAKLGHRSERIASELTSPRRSKETILRSWQDGNRGNTDSDDICGCTAVTFIVVFSNSQRSPPQAPTVASAPDHTIPGMRKYLCHEALLSNLYLSKTQ